MKIPVSEMAPEITKAMEDAGLEAYSAWEKTNDPYVRNGVRQILIAAFSALEVTPAMTRAGVDAFNEFYDPAAPHAERDIVGRVFAAMWTQAGKK